ncbi:hypothetical protein GCM10011497_00500 [Elstera cyanobacteriorum]|uniref:Flagellin n=1 Tax=Elstera cyanobacteriorum TaxID=2022747 RepID=A0A255XPK4_9PROT|nr:flagellin [Elstera cyanobacteriorum]OYQ18927.1 hypothetical protein CHR90_11815 [Elstera cyanobacteriorum]GFZ76827.1 hypothetical protein GCM10011497_00500 [Elstera cyanobacteriorum]
MATNVTLSSSVRSNLLALQKTQSAIDVTNSRLNTGKKVNTVIDDAVAFFSAKALDDRASDFNDRKANIDQAISGINTALTATTAIDSLLKQLKGIATSAKSATSIERGTLQTQYNTVKAQIDQLVSDASYQGLNLVSNSTSIQTTQFSDRSSSRLVVTAQRLSTYGAGLASQVASNVNSVGTLSNAAGSAAGITAGAVGQYFVKAATSGGALLTYNLVRYDAASTVGGDTASFNVTTVSTRTSQTFAQATASIIQDTYNVVSGLNVFAASQIYILVDANLTGSFAISTISAGTLWSAAAFDVNQSINANDSFNEALDFVIQGLDNSISQNNSVAKALGTNVAILNTRLEFTKEYVNVQKDGSGKLTLADTNEEGANLVSLQTRQQLGVQALAFAGQTEQSVLRLFG